MNTSLCLWLKGIEVALWEMSRGVCRFMFSRLPDWVYRQLVEVVGPAAVNLVRVVVALCVWAGLVVGPAMILLGWDDEICGVVMATLWVALALVGSAWGRSRLKKKQPPPENHVSRKKSPPVDWDEFQDCVARS